jgi:uncharacterized membrane protein
MTRWVRPIMGVLFGAFFVFAGTTHFTNRDFFVSIVPPYLPGAEALVAISGVAEIALGLSLWVPRWSRLAAWGLVALLVAVFPANLHMWMHPEQYPTIAPAALLWRLPLQGVLIAWAYWLTK